MDIEAIAKKIRAAVMDSAEDQGRTFNASILDEVIAKELRVHMPVPIPKPPQQYPWHVVPMTDNKVNVLPPGVTLDMLTIGAGLIEIRPINSDEWR